MTLCGCPFSGGKSLPSWCYITECPKQAARSHCESSTHWPEKMGTKPKVPSSTSSSMFPWKDRLDSLYYYISNALHDHKTVLETFSKVIQDTNTLFYVSFSYGSANLFKDRLRGWLRHTRLGSLKHEYLSCG